MDEQSLEVLRGMLMLDPNKRFTAVDCLSCSWFDNLREESVEQLIRNDRNIREQQQLQREYNNGSGQTLKEKRGESSKSRA
jgi:serine/threonine protein kinase